MSLLKKLFNRNQKNMLEKYRLANNWLKTNSVKGKGVKVTAQRSDEVYPEVTGYFIPSLLSWGERELAVQFADWLVSIQNSDGSWNDPSGKCAYTFDTGQILKGLLAFSEYCSEYDQSIKRGCEWILQQIQSSGRVTTPDTNSWRLPNNKIVPEAIHLYALQPLKDAGERWGIEDYTSAVDRALAYYLADESLTEFSTLSHFHAYIIEALVDLGYSEWAKSAMDNVAKYQKKNGSVSAYYDVKWVCSTGLFQYAIIWYKLGELSRANRAFDYACSLQNSSGGFYGGYGKKANYFPNEEISWAVKYFLDSFWWKIRTSFDTDLSVFPDTIDKNDGRYKLISQAIDVVAPQKVLDIGCGKGRFIKNIKSDYPQTETVGMDISDEMLKFLPSDTVGMKGSLLNIPCNDEFFDFAFCVEALEHAVNIPAAVREMGRVVARKGTLIIIDKNRDKLGALKISDWEQWFKGEEITKLLQREGFEVSLVDDISYSNVGSDGLFIGWIARKI